MYRHEIIMDQDQIGFKVNICIITSCKTLSICLSDHSMALVNIENYIWKTGKGMWKLNTIFF